MIDPDTRMFWLRDQRLASVALSPLPAWLWSADASHIVWANPIGAAVFGAPNASTLAARKFDLGQPAAAQIARLATTTLSATSSGASHHEHSEQDPAPLEHLRGFGAGIGRTLACRCTRITLADGTDAILVEATERSGPDLPKRERAQRLLAGCDEPVVVASADGDILHGTPDALAHWPTGKAPSDGSVGNLLDEARRTGHAEGPIALGTATIDRIGQGESLGLVMRIRPPVEKPLTRPDAALEASAAVRAEWHRPSPPDEPLRNEAGLEAAQSPGPEPATAEVRSASHQIRPNFAPASPEPDLSHAEAPPPLVSAKSSETSAVEPAAHDEISDFDEWQHPLRFIWRTDAEGHFTLESDEFLAFAGAPTANALGQPWSDVSAALGIDPRGEVQRALASEATWSGISLAWPIGGGGTPLAVELSGLPTFDRSRTFVGYRGFGVCRDVKHLNALTRAAGQPVLWTASPRTSEPADVAQQPQPLHADPHGTPTTPSLTPRERHAFHELSRRLTERLSSAGPVISGKDQDRTGARAAVSVAEDWGSDVTTLPDGSNDGSPVHRIREAVAPSAAGPGTAPQASTSILDKLPIGVLIYRPGELLYANEAFLRWAGSDSVEALEAAGGLDSLFTEPGAVALTNGSDKPFAIANNRGEAMAVEGHLFLVPWEGRPAFVLTTTPAIAASAAATTLSPTHAGDRSRVGSAFSGKADVLAKLSHAVRTQLNAISGFSEVMMDERFGPIGNERYRLYLMDIQTSAGQIITFMNDLFELSDIEAGEFGLSFTGVALNDIAQACIGLLQSRAARERTIVRSALAQKLPPVVADAQSIQQMVLNLLGNSIKSAGAGGQAIVTTAVTDAGDVVLRVRDTGVGMSAKDISVALEPLCQLAVTTRFGNGLELALTKALAEANHASFHITSKRDTGTLIEVRFPSAQVLAPDTPSEAPPGMRRADGTEHA